MPDKILQGTLTGGSGLQDVERDISTLQSQYHPESISDFNDVMQSVSQLAYQTRQTAEQSQLDKQFDPTQVSGGTFSDIMSWTEKHRGADISKIATSTARGFQEQQRQVGSMLEKMTADRDRLKKDAQNFKFEMAAKYPGVFELLTDDEKQSIDDGDPSQGVFAKFDAYTSEQKRKEEAWEAEKRNMQRASYSRTNANNAKDKEINAFIMESAAVLNGERGMDGYADPRAVNDMIQKGTALFGSAFQSKAKIYDSFVAPGKTAAELTLERNLAEEERTATQERQARTTEIEEHAGTAKGEYYDTGKGWWNMKDEDEILWNDFLNDYPQLKKDITLAGEVRRELERQGYKIR